MNINDLSKRILVAAIAGLTYIACACPAVDAQQAGSSDRVEGSFDVPGWFSKEQSDIARYPVPLFQTPAQTSSSSGSSSPLVVIQKYGPPGAPDMFTSKSVWTPTAFGYQTRSDFSALASNPWAAPGAAPMGFGFAGLPYGGFGGFGGYVPSIPFAGGLGGGLAGIVSGFLPSWSSYRWGVSGAGTPYFSGAGFGPGFAGPGFGFPGYGGGVSQTIVIPTETKKVGNDYYAPSNSGNSGSNYYSSGAPVVQPNAVTIPPRQSPREYWGETGNPFGKDLNKTPW